jgi:hypothetical protein
MFFLPRQTSLFTRLQLGRTNQKPDALSGIAADGLLSMARAFLLFQMQKYSPCL